MTPTNSRSTAARSPFGELLVKLRTARGLTQENLANAIQGARIAPRSITGYEKSSTSPRDWVLPHRPALKLLAEAMALDMVDQHALVVAWNNSRKLRAATPSAQQQSDFVSAGRESAVDTILDSWDQALKGIPQVVFLGGIAGIGKSALARHASDVIAASTKKVMVSWGGASSWATDVEPYLSIRSATDRILVTPDASSTLPGNYPSRPSLGSEEIHRVIDSIPLLANAIISERALREMASAHGTEYTDNVDAMLATRSGTQTTGRQEEYVRLLVRLSKSWPIVIVLEDMHWAGEQTTTLMLHLARQLQNMRDTPILFICTYRNDELQSGDGREIHPFSRLLNSIGHSSQVRLETLNESMSPTSGMAFVRAVVEQTPMPTTDADNLASYLYEQTSGHPLLTGEMKRHLLESQALAPTSDGMWVFDTSRIPAETPSAISTFIGQRLNRVTSRGKRILEIASVMNDVILSEIVADTMEAEEEEILEKINQELVGTHQLLLSGTPVSHVQRSYSTYRFPHALFREFIYNQMPDARRKRLHLAVANAMEQHYTEADTTALSEITSHYIKAEEWPSAQMSGYRLAQHAAYKLDWDLAKIWFAQAEELSIRAKDPQQLWRTRAAKLAMLRGTGRYQDAVDLGERIIQLADDHNWQNTLGLASHHLGEVYYDLGRVERAVECLERAITLHLQADALDMAAAGMAMLSHATQRQGKYDVARKHALEALTLARKLHNSWVQPEAVLAAANCELDLGFYAEAIENYNLAVELATMVGKLQNQFIPAINVGLCYTFMGDHQRAIDHLTPLIEQMKALMFWRITAPAQLYLGYAYEALGNAEAAVEAYMDASRLRRQHAAGPVLMDSMAGELRMKLQQGRDADARRLLAEITRYLSENGWEGIEYPVLVKLSVARARLHFRDRSGYEEYINRAHALLMKNAGMIEDPASRESYLSNVPFAVEVQSHYDDLNETVRKR